MKATAKLYLLTSASIATLVLPGAAMAQDAAAGPVVRTTPAAPAAAPAGPSGPADIIVTARRTEERLQDVPISITVYSQQQLENRNIVVASDLATYTPSLSSNQRFGPEKSTFAIRGFNQDAGTAPTVGVYFADVVGVRAQGGTASGNTVGAGTFTDLQNVQVLKGPQGTLFGRNTTGGAVLLVPRKPTDSFGGYVEGSYGNYDMRRVQAALNVPVSESLRVRGSIDRMKRDGYLRNRSGIGPGRYNDTDYFYGRLSVVADITPNLENYLIGQYSKSDTNGYAAKVTACDRAFANNPATPRQIILAGGVRFPNTRLATAAAACDQEDRQNARGDGKLDVDVNNANPLLKLETWQAINTTTWRVSDLMTIKNIVSYGEFRETASFSINNDNFFIPQQFAGIYPVGQRFQSIVLAPLPGSNAAAQRSITEELQVQGNSADGNLNYVVGGYLEFSRPIGFSSNLTSINGICTSLQTLECTAPLGLAFISQSRTKLDFDNHGIFAQGSYKFTEQLSLTLGGRYTFDRISGLGRGTRYNLAQIPGGRTIIASQACNDSVRHPGVNVLPSGNDSLCDTRITNKSNRPTWLIGLDYKPSDDALIYAKYSRGYRQGGLNFTNVGLETWGPEKVNAYEVGTKLSFRGPVSGTFNVSGFYNDFQGQQIVGGLTARLGSGISGGSGIVNAGRSEIYGVEMDASAVLFDRLRIDGGYTYLRSKIKELIAPDLTGTPFEFFVPTSRVGDPLTLSPRHRLTATGTYTLIDQDDIGQLSVGTTYTYTAKQFSVVTSPIGQLPAMHLLNLNLNWEKVGGSGVDLAAFATNITNNIYPVSVSNGFVSYGYEGLSYSQPRMYGVRLRYNFGS